MKGKLLFVVGLGVGYVLGTRAGRERYEQIARAADRVWNQPAVQQGVGAAKEFAASKLGDVSETVLDGVKQFIGSQTSKGRSSSQSSGAARASSSNSSASAAKTNGAKANGTKANGAKANGTKSTASKSNGATSNGSSSAGSNSTAASDS
jgi:hypothetical protein